MKRIILLLLIVSSGFTMLSQESDSLEEKKVKHYNLIKIGSSFQVDVYYFGYYEYDYYYDGYDRYYYPDGPNAMLYLGYEHIWEFENKTAFALEPKVGISFREHANHGMLGNDAKFYWTNKEIWRMGIAISTDYIFGSNETTITVPMDNGNYYERRKINMYYHNLSIDIGIIPFQFRLRNVPIVIESQFSLTGFSILMERSQNYTGPDGNKMHTFDSSVYPYFLKGELKIGYVFP